MQQLHLVGLTTDLDSIICSARKGAKSGSFVLPLDEHLLQVIADAVGRRNADGIEIEVPEALQPQAATAPRRQSHLSPREIQDRLRAGRSMAEIAAEAGVGEEWVARFAAPVEAERSQVIGRARRLVYYRPRRGDSGEALGMAVRWNLADRGVRLANDEFEASWSAYQLADTAWMVTFSYEARKRDHEAEWEVDLATNELLSRNRLATELGYVEPGRRRRAMASLQPVATAAAVRAHALEAAGGAGAADGRGGGDEDDVTSDVRRARPAANKPAQPRATARPAKKATGRPAKKATGRPAKKPTARPAAKKATARPAAKKATARPAKRAMARPAKKATGRPAKKATARPAAKTVTPPSKRATPKKAVAGRAAKPVAKRTTKKAAGRSTTRRTGRGVPPAQVPVAATDDRPVPNELGRRRLQLVSGTGPVRPATRTGSGRMSASPSNPGVRIAAVRSGDVAAAQRQARRPDRPTIAPQEIVAPEPNLDVSDSEAAAEARRAERRRARAAARSGSSAPQASAPQTPVQTWGRADELDDGRVVTIRANRASPPRGDAELVLPPDRPSLRPAQAATQPRKRRFNRTGR